MAEKGFPPDWVYRQTLDKITKLLKTYSQIERKKAEAIRKQQEQHAQRNRPRGRTRRGRR